MTIYGVALLGACFLLGKLTGTLLGAAIGVDGDVGGVGFAMLLLVLGNNWWKRHGGLHPATAGGVLFWSAMYIPIIVAMAAVQNVRAAVDGGWVAVLAGVAATVGGFLLVPLLARIGRAERPEV